MSNPSVDFITLAEKIRQNFPQFTVNPSPSGMQNGIYAWEQNPAHQRWSTTIDILPTPTIPGEVFAEINTGVPAQSIYALTELSQLITDGNNWETKDNNIIWFIPRQPIAEFMDNDLAFLRTGIKKVKILYATLDLVDIIATDCVTNAESAKKVLRQVYSFISK